MNNLYKIIIEDNQPKYLNYIFTIKLLNIDVPKNLSDTNIPDSYINGLYSNIRVFKKDNTLFSFFIIVNSSSFAKNALKRLTTETNIFNVKSKILLNNAEKYELIITKEFIKKHTCELLKYI
jgi:hypothetical protein